MCGRYYIDEETADELEALVHILDRKINGAIFRGDIRPSMQAPILYKQNNRISLGASKWGFLKYQGTGLIINARAETCLLYTSRRI